MKTILIVEDWPIEQEKYKSGLPEFDLLQATNFSEAVQHFKEHQTEIAAIVLDGHLSKYEYGHALAAAFREQGYTGPMLATSSDDGLRARLMECGCDHAVNKNDVPDYLRRILA